MLETKAKAIRDKLADRAIADLPWETILEFIMAMIPICFPTAESAIAAKNMGVAQKAALGVWIRREFGIRGMRLVNEVRQAILDELDASADNEIAEAWHEANRELQPNLGVL
jgi:hypothetical protein